MAILSAAAMVQSATLVASAPVDGPPNMFRTQLSMYLLCLDGEIGAPDNPPSTVEAARAAYAAARVPCRPVRQLAMSRADRAVSNDPDSGEPEERQAMIAEWFDRMDRLCNQCSAIAQHEAEAQKPPERPQGPISNPSASMQGSNRAGSP